jgi:large subunit ribosomal protein L7/L12
VSEATAEVSEGKEYSPKVTEVLDKIGVFTLIELSELVEAFEDRFNVKAAAAPVAMAAGAVSAGGAAAAEEEEEVTEFDVVLKGFGENKIQVIKAVRSMTSLALKEAKQVVEGVPSNIQEGVSKEDGDKAVATLKEAGAEAELKPHSG